MSGCLHCSNELTGKQQFYCSEAHQRAAQDKRRRRGMTETWRRAKRPCVRCGASLFVFPDHKYCGECLVIIRRALAFTRSHKNRKNKSCFVCGIVLPKKRIKYCSRQCRETSTTKTEPEPYNLDCANCGTPFSPSRVNVKYCSARCREIVKYRKKKQYGRKRTDRDRDRDRARYRGHNFLEKRRNRRALMLAARQVYQELMGEAPTYEKPFVTLAAAAPMVEIGDWSSYIVLPSHIRRNISKQKLGLRRTPVLVTRDGFVSYVVHRGGPWRPYVNKVYREWGRDIPGSYAGCKIAHSRHFSKRRDRSYPKKYYPNNEQRRIKQRVDNDIFTAFKELNLLPTEE